MNKLSEKSLKQLASLKKRALAQTDEQFPEKFYFFAVFFLTSTIFQQIIDEIDREWAEDHAIYNQMVVGILRLVDHILQNIIRYTQGKHIASKILVEINFLSSSKGEGLVEIFKKVWSIEKIYKEFTKGQHSSLTTEMQPKLSLLREKLNQIGKENERLRKLSEKRLWEPLRRLRGILAIYNVKEYKSIRGELVESGEEANLQSLDIRYEGLSKCIYPEEEQLSYDENFGMKDDKRAIKEIYAAAECELRRNACYQQSNGKLIFTKNGEIINITYDEKSFSVGEKSEEKKANKRKNLAALFVRNSKVLGRRVFDAISDLIPGSGGLSVDELKEVINTKNDLNREIKEKLGVKNSIKLKSIDKEYGKIELFINPQYQ